MSQRLQIAFEYFPSAKLQQSLSMLVNYKQGKLNSSIKNDILQQKTTVSAKESSGN